MQDWRKRADTNRNPNSSEKQEKIGYHSSEPPHVNLFQIYRSALESVAIICPRYISCQISKYLSPLESGNLQLEQTPCVSLCFAKFPSDYAKGYRAQGTSAHSRYVLSIPVPVFLPTKSVYTSADAFNDYRNQGMVSVY